MTDGAINCNHGGSQRVEVGFRMVPKHLLTEKVESKTNMYSFFTDCRVRLTLLSTTSLSYGQKQREATANEAGCLNADDVSNSQSLAGVVGLL